MIIDSDAIRYELAAIWPRFKFIVLSDGQWILPSEPDLAEFLSGYQPPKYVERLFECEEIALDLVSAQRRHQSQAYLLGLLPASQVFNWPLGVVCGTRFSGRDMDHWQNICRTRTGWRLVEPQTKAVWRPDPPDDEIYFLFM